MRSPKDVKDWSAQGPENEKAELSWSSLRSNVGGANESQTIRSLYQPAMVLVGLYRYKQKYCTSDGGSNSDWNSGSYCSRTYLLPLLSFSLSRTTHP